MLGDFAVARPERARELGLDQVEVVLSNDRSTELPENSVDVVFLCDVYHHFEYHEDMLRSIRRALKPGGRFVFVDCHFCIMWLALLWGFQGRMETWARQSERFRIRAGYSYEAQLFEKCCLLLIPSSE